MVTAPFPSQPEWIYTSVFHCLKRGPERVYSFSRWLGRQQIGSEGDSRALLLEPAGKASLIPFLNSRDRAVQQANEHPHGEAVDVADMLVLCKSSAPMLNCVNA